MNAALTIRDAEFVEAHDDAERVDIPPMDLDAEAATLSAILIEETCLARVVDFLRAEHFYSDSHARIYTAMVALREAKQPIDIRTVGTRLKDTRRLEQVGGMAYLTTLLNAAPTIVNVVAYALTVHEKWRARQVILTCQRIVAHGYEGVPDVQDYCERAAKAIARLSDKNPLRPVESNDEALARILAALNPSAPPESRKTAHGYPTGIYTLDAEVCGLLPQHKTTVAATTGAGKTAFALQIALKLAKEGVGVLFFSTELRREELLRRALAHEANVPNDRIKRRALTKEDFAAVADAAMRLRSLPLRIDETPRITIEEIRAATVAHVERLKLYERVPLGLVILDYVQRLEVRRDLQHLKDHERIRHSTRTFKQMLQELNLAGIELAQGKPGEKGRKPSKETGVADSSAISKEADELLFLVEDGNAGQWRDVTLHVAKQRDGREGAAIPLQFYGDVFRFEDPRDPMRPVSRNYLTEGM